MPLETLYPQIVSFWKNVEGKMENIEFPVPCFTDKMGKFWGQYVNKTQWKVPRETLVHQYIWDHKFYYPRHTFAERLQKEILA
jgi:hypothetical protein